MTAKIESVLYSANTFAFVSINIRIIDLYLNLDVNIAITFFPTKKSFTYPYLYLKNQKNRIKKYNFAKKATTNLFTKDIKQRQNNKI